MDVVSMAFSTKLLMIIARKELKDLFELPVVVSRIGPDRAYHIHFILQQLL